MILIHISCTFSSDAHTCKLGPYMVLKRDLANSWRRSLPVLLAKWMCHIQRVYTYSKYQLLEANSNRILLRVSYKFCLW